MAVYPLGVNVGLPELADTLHAVEVPTAAEPVPEPSAPVKYATAIAPIASAPSVPSAANTFLRLLDMLSLLGSPTGSASRRCVPASFLRALPCAEGAADMGPPPVELCPLD